MLFTTPLQESLAEVHVGKQVPGSISAEGFPADGPRLHWASHQALILSWPRPTPTISHWQCVGWTWPTPPWSLIPFCTTYSISSHPVGSLYTLGLMPRSSYLNRSFGDLSPECGVSGKSPLCRHIQHRNEHTPWHSVSQVRPRVLFLPIPQAWWTFCNMQIIPSWLPTHQLDVTVSSEHHLRLAGVVWNGSQVPKSQCLTLQSSSGKLIDPHLSLNG